MSAMPKPPLYCLKSQGAIKVLIASGASAGHLYPALSLAGNLRKKNPDIEISFISTKRKGLEVKIEEAGYKLFLIPVTALSLERHIRLPIEDPSSRRFAPPPRFASQSEAGGDKQSEAAGLRLKKICQKFLAEGQIFLSAVYLWLKSFLKVFLIIEKFRPDVVVGFGAYVSFPVLLEAAFFKKKTVIHEQNVSLGLANKMLCPFVDRVALSFRQTPVPKSPKGKFVLTGNPIRENFMIQDKAQARGFFALEDKFTILAVGGSQGAHKINMEFKKTVDLLAGKTIFQFIHITGQTDYISLQEEYKHVKIEYRIFEFLNRMDLAYLIADLVIARAGAGTIAELASFGKPALLIPYPYAGAHQLENALALKAQGAARVIEEINLNASVLSENIIDLMDSESKRQELIINIRKFANIDAADKLANLVLSLAGQ